MGWRQSLRPASFRGVAFFVTADSMQFGRRVSIHEYPQRDKPFVEDLGKKARQYEIEAYVIGPNYMEQRDALISACERPGSGELIHPKYGSVYVVASGEGEVSESTDYGGMAKIRLSFIEAGERLEPTQSTDTVAKINSTKLTLRQKVTQWFEKNFNVSGLQDFVSNDAIECLQTLQDAAGFSLDALSTARDFISGDLSILNPKNLATAVLAPSELGNGILNLINKTENLQRLSTFSLSDRQKSQDLEQGSSGPLDDNGVSDTNKVSTPESQAIENNRQAIEQLVQVASTEKLIAQVVLEGNIQTAEDTVHAKESILQLVDEVVLEPRVDAETINALLDYRDAVIGHLIELTPKLPKVEVVRTRLDLPAAVIAYQQYGNQWLEKQRDLEIARRNRVIHLGFVPAGAVEVVHYDE